MLSINNQYLELIKKPQLPSEILDGSSATDYSKGFFDDGFVHRWETGITPGHIHFEVQTTSTILDSCSVHMYTLEDDPSNTNVQDAAHKQRWFIGPPGPDGYARVKNSDVFLFRLGYFDHMKLNVESMIMPSTQDQWYVIDLLIDWDAQLVSIYIDNEANSAQPFFLMRASRVESTNAISIYGLSPESTSKFRNLQVCEHRCIVDGCKFIAGINCVSLYSKK